MFAATLYAKALRIPLVMSYHTHIPEYIPKYTWQVGLYLLQNVLLFTTTWLLSAVTVTRCRAMTKIVIFVNKVCVLLLLPVTFSRRKLHQCSLENLLV
jgi:hypothetical protein